MASSSAPHASPPSAPLNGGGGSSTEEDPAQDPDLPDARATPIPWEEAKAILEDGSLAAMARLQRSEEQRRVYWAFQKKLRAEYSSLVDYLEISLFGCEAGKAEDGRTRSGGLPEEERAEGGAPRLVWRANDFPYHWDDPMTHHVLWSTKPLPPERLEAEIAAKFPGSSGFETLHFVNPAPLQSVTAIWHAHVLVRRSGCVKNLS